MRGTKIKVEYIYHSGYAVETENYYMVFDYFKGDIELPDKPVIVFVSHSHPDHFNEDIFKWTLASDDITYILSDDIMVPSNGRIRLMGPYERLDFTDFSVETFGSTDQGVSFLVQVDGASLFFAGDLHWWHWEEDSLEEKAQMERDFKSEIDRIRGKQIDLAFFPVDPRLGDHYSLGGKYFVDNIKPKHFFPLHFGDNFEIINEFINIPMANSTHIHGIHKRNHIFEIK